MAPRLVRSYTTYYDGDQFHVKFFSGDTSVKATEWNRECEKTVYIKEIESGRWIKIADRQLVWEYDQIDKDVHSHCVCICYT